MVEVKDLLQVLGSHELEPETGALAEAVRSMAVIGGGGSDLSSTGRAVELERRSRSWRRGD